MVDFQMQQEDAIENERRKVFSWFDKLSTKKKNRYIQNIPLSDLTMNIIQFYRMQLLSNSDNDCNSKCDDILSSTLFAFIIHTSCMSSSNNNNNNSNKKKNLIKKKRQVSIYSFDDFVKTTTNDNNSKRSVKDIRGNTSNDDDTTTNNNENTKKSPLYKLFKDKLTKHLETSKYNQLEVNLFLNNYTLIYWKKKRLLPTTITTTSSSLSYKNISLQINNSDDKLFHVLSKCI